MKVYFILSAALLIFSCNDLKTKNGSDHKANATVQTVNDLYIFIKSKPTSEYDFLGAIELKWYDKITKLDEQSLSSVIHNLAGIVSFSDNLVNTLKEVAQKYPAAEGIIFDDDMSRCEVIKFKN